MQLYNYKISPGTGLDSFENHNLCLQFYKRTKSVNDISVSVTFTLIQHGIFYILWITNNNFHPSGVIIIITETDLVLKI